jgi:putative transposase
LLSQVVRTRSPGHLKTFDYIGFQRYFLTFCTKDRERLFVLPEPVDLVRTQILRAAGNESLKSLLTASCQIMCTPAERLTETADGLRFVARAKQFSGFYYSKQFGKPLWQRYGYEHVLRTDEESLGVAKYILENPVRAGLVLSPQDYEFSSSPRYTVEDVLDAVSWTRARSG